MRLLNGFVGTSWHWLREHQPPLTTLIGLYLTLALAAFSIIIAVLAASDLASRLPRKRRGYRRI